MEQDCHIYYCTTVLKNTFQYICTFHQISLTIGFYDIIYIIAEATSSIPPTPTPTFLPHFQMLSVEDIVNEGYISSQKTDCPQCNPIQSSLLENKPNS